MKQPTKSWTAVDRLTEKPKGSQVLVLSDHPNLTTLKAYPLLAESKRGLDASDKVFYTVTGDNGDYVSVSEDLVEIVSPVGHGEMEF
jgi:hypothetical protein